MLALVIMVQYGMMTGGGVSTMRAVTMFLLSVGAKIVGRIYDLPTAMAVAAILILVESPTYMLDGGFLLSFGAVTGVGCIWPLIWEGMERAEKKEKHRRKVPAKLSGICGSTAYHTSHCAVVLWRSVGDRDFSEFTGTSYSGSGAGKWVCSSFDGTFQPEGILAGSYSGQSGAWGL